LWPRLRRGTRRYRLRGDRSIELRENSTDGNVFEEIFIERVYAPHAAAVPPGAGPLVLIDLGANIGLSAIALARQLHPVRVVAVEPDAANFSMLLENLRRAGLSTRSVALQAFAGAEPGFAELQDAGYGAWGMRMGPASGSGIPVLPVAGIVACAGASGRVVLKCDIEGSERQLFEHMRAWERLVDFIILELHTEFFPTGALRACLAGSRFEWRIHGEIPPGACLAVFGIERLQEKPVAIGQTAGLAEFC
jgi:FkbM family methyltransferase